MKWIKPIKIKDKNKPKKNKPKWGDTKEVVRFAFIPTRINNNQMVFWERYINIYTYSKSIFNEYNLSIFDSPADAKTNKYYYFWEKIDRKCYKIII